ncbi:MAG: GNAT family N-acetyltransferase [Vicinamibacterales bacterium]
MNIRDATSADRAFVLDLASRLASFEIPSWRTREEVVEGERRVLEAWFDEPLEDQAMFVAELDGQRAGCAFLLTEIDYFNLRPCAHLSVLAATAAAEGRGVGSALLDRSVEWARARGSDRLTLSALVTNTRARGLYERRGFSGEYIRYVLPL